MVIERVQNRQEPWQRKSKAVLASINFKSELYVQNRGAGKQLTIDNPAPASAVLNYKSTDTLPNEPRHIVYQAIVSGDLSRAAGCWLRLHGST